MPKLGKSNPPLPDGLLPLLAPRGSDFPDMTARERYWRRCLAERNRFLGVYVAKRFNGTLGVSDELASAAFLAIVKAAKNYDPRHGASFGAYAGRAVWSACRRETTDARLIHAPPRTRYTEAAVRTRRVGHLVAYGDGEPGPTEPAAREPSSDVAEYELPALVARLPERLRRVVVLTFFQGKTLEQAGRECGFVSKERVRQLRDEAVGRLREWVLS